MVSAGDVFHPLEVGVFIHGPGQVQKLVSKDGLWDGPGNKLFQGSDTDGVQHFLYFRLPGAQVTLTKQIRFHRMDVCFLRLRLKILCAELRGIFDPSIILKVLANPKAEPWGMRERDALQTANIDKPALIQQERNHVM